MKKIRLTFILCICFHLAWAQEDKCTPSGVTHGALQDISEHIEENPAATKTIQAETLNAGDVIKTGEDEYIRITVNQPKLVEYTIYPLSEVQILQLPNKKCGIELLLNGKILSKGEHLVENSCIELHTPEAEVIPEGTTYIVETNALSNALAELNEEMGLVDPYPSGTQEKYSVKDGSIQVRLKKANKKGIRVKYTKIKTKKKKIVAKSAKTKSKMFVYNNGKIKLNAGSSLKIKRNRKLKRQVADLEVITPN